MPCIYDGCTRIHFPIHTSRQFARRVGLPDIILQETATLALAVKELVDREAGSDPQQIKSISCPFTEMLMPGETFLLKASSPDRNNSLFFQVMNGGGRRAVSQGHIKLERRETPFNLTLKQKYEK
jgi:acyl dehydratase